MTHSSNEFDEKAKSWDNDPDRVHRAKRIAGAILKLVPIKPSFSALEFGCGTGLLSFALREHFAQIILVDSSPGMLAVLNDKIVQSGATNMQTRNVDLLADPAGLSATFSIVYSALVLHHISDIEKIISTWHNILDDAGYLCIADLDSEKGLFHGQEFSGHNGFDRAALSKLVEQAGFTVVACETVCELTKIARDGAEHTFPVFLLVGQKK
jgi:ubiquinone/menaquinone biosynthesis C-methylase UbiE